MGVKGTEHIEFFSKDEEGRFHKIHDVTNTITDYPKPEIIDGKWREMFEPIEFSAYLVTYEDEIRMTNAKDVTPEEEK
jgi:hypothetical protein